MPKWFDNMPAQDRVGLVRIASWTGGVLVLMIGAFMYFDAVDADRRKQLEPWAAMAREPLEPTESLEPGGGYVKGRILPIDQVRREVDFIHFSMRDDVRSQKPDDVGTIAWLRHGEKVVGEYTGGSKAHVRTTSVTIIDKARKVIVARRDIEGPPPPETVRQGSPGYGGWPTNEILSYLYSLPKRP